MKRGCGPKGAKFDELLAATAALGDISDRDQLIQQVKQISTSAIGPAGLVHLLNAEADQAQSQARRDR